MTKDVLAVIAVLLGCTGAADLAFLLLHRGVGNARVLIRVLYALALLGFGAYMYFGSPFSSTLKALDVEFWGMVTFLIVVLGAFLVTYTSRRVR